jgi:hypothetical protein
MIRTGYDRERGYVRELKDGESLDKNGNIRPVPAGVENKPY